MKNPKLLFFVLSAILFFTVSAKASSLSAIQNLSFGTLVPTAASGSVTISTAGAINTGGSVTIAPSGTAYYQGVVRFTPTILDVFTFSIVTSSITLTNSTSGGGSVVVDNFTVSPTSLNITLLAPVNVNIGGRMTFSSSSRAGIYNGTVTARASSLLGGTLDVQLPVTLTLWSTLSVSEAVQMSFGSIEVSAGSAVVNINPQSGIRTIVSGTVNLGSSPAPAAGLFNISGQANTAVSISLPSSATLTGSKGGTMTINNFNGYPSSTSLTLNASGSNSLYVGANLNIGASQASGTYNGTYTFTVNY